MLPVSIAAIAAFLDAPFTGEAERLIFGVSTPESADVGDLVFVSSSEHAAFAAAAGAVLARPDLDLALNTAVIRVDDPAAAMAQVVEWLFPATRTFSGVSPTAIVEPSARLGEDVGIGPLAYVGANVRIGDRTEVHPTATVGRNVRIGCDCVVHSGVHIYPETVVGDRVVLHAGVVLGADGFGYVREPIPQGAATPDEPLRHRKIRQIGHVVIEDDVEIGANSTIDRASLAETRIGRGTKIDNLVTIGHNCRIGRHCIVVGQAGISGSTVLDDYVTVAGQAGLAGHIRVGARAVVGAQAGVTKDIRPGEVVLGSPAIDAGRARKGYVLIESLPDFKRRLADHERRLHDLERP
jgi:UDP-3-O-[3-hydroxymyristoyl] glucosamine N-acyltransferase